MLIPCGMNVCPQPSGIVCVYRKNSKDGSMCQVHSIPYLILWRVSCCQSHIYILSQSQSGWWISHGLGESSWIFLAFLRMCVCIFRLSIPPQNMCLFHIINSRSLAKHFQEKTNSKQLRLSPVPRTAEVPGVDHPLGTKSIVEAHCPWFRSTGRVSHPASRP